MCQRLDARDPAQGFVQHVHLVGEVTQVPLVPPLALTSC